MKVKAFLERKNIEISLRRYGVEAMGAMALGLFASLIIGLILEEIGKHTGVLFLQEMGVNAKGAIGYAIGVAVAHGLKAPPLVLFASAATGFAGNKLGGPAGAFIAAVIGAEFGKIVSKETKIDIIVTPVVTIFTGMGVGMLVGPAINGFMKATGSLIMWATELMPVPMGVLVSVVMGMVLTAPISSAALAIMLDLNGIAAGAACAGCCANMVGFAVSSYRENKVNGLLSQGLGTSMLQVPNIVKNPRIWIPPIVASAVVGPISSAVFKMENIPSGAGMGTSGLVGQFGMLTATGYSPAA
ncbi:MAG: PTS sugar transporter subunit IIC, partial [Clostridiales bacterium]|nr:PTS sugar transporter subunit IIC [Clostridiales bacterium]